MIRKFDLVVALYIFGVITAELMGSKTFPLLNTSWAHLNTTVAIFVMPLLFTMVDAVIEVYGKARARSMVWSGLTIVALLVVYSLIATSLPPSHRFSTTESAYDTIFRSSIQISLASLAAFAASELLDIAVFSKLRQALKGRALWLRNNLTNFVAQFVDSTVFMTLAFYSIHQAFGANFSFLISLIIPYWLIRCGLSVIETPLVYAGVWWLRRKDPLWPRLKLALGKQP